jgi:hypothetical protein
VSSTIGTDIGDNEWLVGKESGTDPFGPPTEVAPMAAGIAEPADSALATGPPACVTGS